MAEIKLEPSWLKELHDEFGKAYFAELSHFIKSEKQQGKKLYPPGNLIFAALDNCPIDKVKVVIIGQDPYHGYQQANGLCFSVTDGIPKPPSLINIFQELKKDVGIEIPETGDLLPWAKQGVLLLNATLTVEANKAGSHQNKGWEIFTDRIIEVLNAQKEHLVFMLWGGYAKKKGSRIDRSKHLVLESGHPSPLSANKGHWFGNRHFSKCNSYLVQNGIEPVKWDLNTRLSTSL
ncbi:MAG: uracil-DNA glycosylase [Bacteroidetes bacterium]|nr:uracil-DNA glycosylase [Bacteroidota bacterium]